MSAIAAMEARVYTLNGIHAFFEAVAEGAKCEIDAALFEYFIEACPPTAMNCEVIFPNRRGHADFVMPGPDRERPLRAFWIEFQDNNTNDRRYFSQNAVGLVR